MPKHVTTPDAYRFWLDGALALSEVEAAGVRVDREYLDSAVVTLTEKIKHHDAALRADPIYATWRRKFGDKTNTASPDQLARIVFGELGYAAPKKTASGDRDAADEAAFTHVIPREPWLKHYFAATKCRKGRDTYLVGIQREMVRHPDGCYYVHPSYNQNTVASFRSSCNSPNFQNNPGRNPEIAEIVRRCYKARIGHQLVELDYGQIEVRIPCCYNFDPTLIAYVTDDSKDMHRDTAVQLFKLAPKEVSKAARHSAKNQFVFPTFYGSYYAQCAPQLWDAAAAASVEGATVETGRRDETTGKPLTRPKTVREHLAEKGVTELGACDPETGPAPGTFEYLVKEIEDDFWGRRFKVYAQWKRDWYAAYCRDGGFTMLTGFAVNIVLDKKQVSNYPIQGTAFHCCLWSLIRIVRWLRKYKMRSRVIGEIHDCINLDVHPAERDDVIYNSKRIMTEDIRRAFPWLNVPLTVEPEACPIDGSWFQKMALAERGGTWVPADVVKWEKNYGVWV